MTWVEIIIATAGLNDALLLLSLWVTLLLFYRLYGIDRMAGGLFLVAAVCPYLFFQIEERPQR